MLYPAANRDPGHFTSPDSFDPARPQSYGHASFGFGTHFCLGAGLARMEAKALFAELISRYGSICLAGDPDPLRARAAERVGDPSGHPSPVAAAEVKGGLVKITVDRDRCVGSAYCQRIAPATFDLGDDGIAVVLDADVTGAAGGRGPGSRSGLPVDGHLDPGILTSCPATRNVLPEADRRSWRDDRCTTWESW